MTRNLRTALTLVIGLSSYALAQPDTTRPAPAAPAAPENATKDWAQAGVSTSIQVLGSRPLASGSEDAVDRLGWGIGLSAEVTGPLPDAPNSPFDFVFGGYFIYNSMPRPPDRYYGSMSGELLYVASTEPEGWTNIGFLGGIRAYLPGTDGGYVQGMGGLNLVMPGDVTYSNRYASGETTSTKTGSTESSFVFSLGIGKRTGPFDISLRYLNMGNPEIEFKSESSSGEQSRTKSVEKISMMVLGFGYSF